MDSAVANALKRRAEIKAELKTIESFLELYDHFKNGTEPSQALMKFDEPEPERSESSVAPAPVVAEAVPYQPPKRGLSKEALKPWIEAMITDAGKPLTRGQLLRALDNRGIPVGGEANRPKNMGTILWRLRDDFVSLSGYGYWPRRLPYPPAGYVPEADAT